MSILKRSAALAAVSIATTVCAPVFAQQPAAPAAGGPKVLKMQSSWPASSTAQDHFKLFAERVDKLSGGQLKIEAMASGQVVPPFEVLDAAAKKVIDGHHSISYYWVGKNNAAVLFAGPPGGPFGMDHSDYLSWMWNGGGTEMWNDLYQNTLKLNVFVMPGHPTSPQAFGWFKRPIKSLADFKTMKCRQTGINAQIFTRMGMTTINLPGGEILPAAQRGVIDCAEWVGGIEDLRLGLHTVYKFHYTPGMHENNTMGEVVFNGDVWKGLSPVQQEIIRSSVRDASISWYAAWQKQNADALKEMQEKHGVKVLRTPTEVLNAYLKAWDGFVEEESGKNPVFKKIIDSQKAWASVVVPAKRFMHPPYSFAANHYWPEAKAAEGKKK